MESDPREQRKNSEQCMIACFLLEQAQIYAWNVLRSLLTLYLHEKFSKNLFQHFRKRVCRIFGSKNSTVYVRGVLFIKELMVTIVKSLIYRYFPLMDLVRGFRTLHLKYWLRKK